MKTDPEQELRDRTPLGLFGQLHMPLLSSEALHGNPLGDPNKREVPVYVPPHASGEKFPVVLLLSAFTGTPYALFEAHPWKRGALWTYDQAVQAGQAKPAILCMPNTFTRLGGSQFVNSSAVGSYQDYILREVLPFVAKRYPADPRRQGVLGKSSGGFGALHLCTQAPGTFQAAASIAGDCHFEYVFGSELLAGLRGLQAFDRDPQRFLDAFFEKPDLKGDGHAVLNMLAMAACYSPNPKAPLGFDLPVDLETGERLPEVWERWLAYDPVQAIPKAPQGLQALDWLYLEAGTRDEFHLQFGLRILCKRLQAAGIAFEHHEFDGGHFGMDVRFQKVLPQMTAALHAL